MTHVSNPPAERPMLLYDGDCGFCRYCVGYARELTAEAIDYAPFQEEGSRFPEIDVEQCRASIQLIGTDGRVSDGAEAAFRTLAASGRRGIWLRLYRRLPGFASLAEWCYRTVAAHRELVFRLSRCLIGGRPRPLEYHRISKLFFRLLALVYLVAFGSHALQVLALYGTEGIIPVGDFLDAAALDADLRWLVLPTVFWLHHADWFLLGVPGLAMVFALALLFGRFESLSLVVLWITYLSIVNTGPVFMQYQWDMLLLEAGFLAIVLQRLPVLGVWLFRWLLFRFMWLSGWVKIAVDDSLWRSFEALGVHFETQPLPNILAWYAHHLPGGILQMAAFLTLVIELLLPVCIFLPRRARLLAFVGFALLQLLIFLTGNYNFFNILTLSLCLFLLDDRRLGGSRAGRRTFMHRPDRNSRATIVLRRAGVVAILLLLLPASLIQLGVVTGHDSPSEHQRRWLAALEPWHVVHHYGVFAVMTRERTEIVIEGSLDGEHWQAYSFRFKPDRLDEPPPWVAPFQPRLDWQLWFAAIEGSPPPWFEHLLLRLLLDSGAVKQLFADVPFSEAPPEYVRALRYRYRFSDRWYREETGEWWTRRYLGIYREPMRIALVSSDAPQELREIPP